VKVTVKATDTFMGNKNILRYFRSVQGAASVLCSALSIRDYFDRSDDEQKKIASKTYSKLITLVVDNGSVCIFDNNAVC